MLCHVPQCLLWTFLSTCCMCLSFSLRLLQRTPQETLFKIKTQEVPYPPELSEGAASFIRAALVRAPEQRASLAELMQHPWLVRHMQMRGAGGGNRGRAQTQVRAAQRKVLCSCCMLTAAPV
jgi:serine/threonine protein kinase